MHTHPTFGFSCIRPNRLFKLFTSFSLLFLLLQDATADPVRFNRDIRPILSAHCYECHGPDENHREAELRFDQEQDDLVERSIVVPHDLASSELIVRISSDDPGRGHASAGNQIRID